MLIFRLVVGLLLFAGVLCFALYIGTGQVVWRRRGVIVIKWTVLAGLGFFAVLILERLAMML
ncbi:hypothetical protein [Roseateles albus]|uniref:Uncharacterized protein n=1 Tax=Roseateles albus TaxID=2987525 RepID=A0ABT5KG64_9BURK|nr:hypothetical protein [Roseateles albus]MDC8771945.1 hypothetical protein [Roseateles albus]